MIEQFSEQELKLIARELGFEESDFIFLSKDVSFCQEKDRIKKFFNGKPIDRSKTLILAMFNMADACLNNYRTTAKGEIICNNKVRRTDIKEYKEILNEFVEILEKHNKPYNE